MKRWTKEELEKAINAHSSGMLMKEIANLLDREFRSVETKLNKLGYKQNKKIVKMTYTCLYCGKEFEGFIKDTRKFCSHSCSSKYYNPIKRKKEYTCLNCKKELKSKQYKYCSLKCQNELKRKNIFKKIENGNTSLYVKNYKKYLIHKYGEKCMKCGWNEINKFTGNVPIQLEHKDGNSENNSLENLELLCPNCHSLTSTYGALNIGNGRQKRKEYRRKKINNNEPYG